TRAWSTSCRRRSALVCRKSPSPSRRRSSEASAPTGMSAHAPAHWSRRGAFAALLLPLSVLFMLLSPTRRASYRAGVLRAARRPVPVIVVGSVAVGGSGERPVVAWLVEALCAAGFPPGIVSRGYGGSVESVALVPADGDAARFGDEPVLLARLTG